MTRPSVPFQLIGALVLSSTVVAAAQQQPTPEQMKAMLEGMKPSAEHRELAALEGRWALEISYNMGPGQTMRARGTGTNRMILGGRFLASDMVLRLVDADTYVSEVIFKFPNAPAQKIVEIVHRRIK